MTRGRGELDQRLYGIMGEVRLERTGYVHFRSILSTPGAGHGRNVSVSSQIAWRLKGSFGVSIVLGL